MACLDYFVKAVPKEFSDKALVEIHKSFFVLEYCSLTPD